MGRKFCNPLDLVSLVAVVAVGLGTFLVMGGRAAAQPPSSVVRDADKVIRDNAKLIVVFAWPSAKEFESVEQVGRVEYLSGGGFATAYEFTFIDSDKKRERFTLRFYYDKTGKMTRITELRRTMFAPTFTAAQIVLELMKEKIRSDPDLRDKPEYQKLLTIQDGSEFLVALLNIAAGKD